MKKIMHSGKGKGLNVQEYLFSYLTPPGGLDPYDFNRYLREWAESPWTKGGFDLPEEVVVSDLKKDQVEDFKRWLIDHDKAADWLGSGDVFYAPAYLFFSEVEKMPKGTWGIHFTNEPFKAFDRGATLEGLALSSWKKEKAKAQCPKNLSDDLGTFEYVFGFAFDATGHDVLSAGRKKYGKNAVLFQTDAGVLVYHSGDEEYQLIFPICSEYNVIPLFLGSGKIVIPTQDDKEEVEFDSLEEVLEYVQDEKRVRANPPLMRL